MLFNSFAFIFVFLPIVFGLSVLMRRVGGVGADVPMLAVASFVFYSVWEPALAPVFIISTVGNFGLAKLLRSMAGRPDLRRWIVSLGVLLNLGALFWYKYWVFVSSTVAAAIGLDYVAPEITLPIGISFFTFQQVAFLIDTYRTNGRGVGFANYSLFVAFFPQLIAGPIVHHAEMMPQFERPRSRILDDVLVGLTIFSIGLAKKVLIADGIAVGISPVFNGAAANPPMLGTAWAASVGYALQIYFDFSGYSDMAIGLGRMFGIRLPYNFASPYKSASIIDFWRRWHITLSRFLRDYLYIALGGGRRGHVRRNLNVFLTMLLGGIWHGAGWTFVIWGALHGAFILVNHSFRNMFPRIHVPQWVGWGLTFVAVVIAWVPFRAPGIEATMAIWKGMVGLNGAVIPGVLATALELVFGRQWLDAAAIGETGISFFAIGVWIPVGLCITFLMPNTQAFMARTAPGIRSPGYPSPYAVGGPWPDGGWLTWARTPAMAALAAVLFGLSITGLKDATEFIYFQF